MPLVAVMAARLLKLEGFAMTARIIVPVTEDLVEEMLGRLSALAHAREGEALARDPRFAMGVYRAAVDTGMMDSVRFKHEYEQP